MSPFKPSREDATRVDSPEKMTEQAISAGKNDREDWAEPEQGRPSRGGAAGNRRDPPHVTVNDKGAPVQEDQASRDPIAALPANASGREKTSSSEDDPGIDEESMYDRRPEEDQNRPPSRRVR